MLPMLPPPPPPPPPPLNKRGREKSEEKLKKAEDVLHAVCGCQRKRTSKKIKIPHKKIKMHDAQVVLPVRTHTQRDGRRVLSPAPACGNTL